MHLSISDRAGILTESVIKLKEPEPSGISALKTEQPEEILGRTADPVRWM